MIKKQLLFLLVLILAIRCSKPVKPDNGNPSEYSHLYDYVWSTYDSLYCFFSYKNVNWDSVYGLYSTEADNAGSVDEIVTTIINMLSHLMDGHSFLIAPDGSQHPTFNPYNDKFLNWNNDVLDYYKSTYNWTQINPIIGYYLIDSFLYIEISQMDLFTDINEFDSLLSKYKDISGIIIDIRKNPGGSSNFSDDIAGRFTVESVTHSFLQYKIGPNHDNFGPLSPWIINPRGDWQYQKPVVVLTGRFCASAAEEFICAMRMQPNVTILGDTTCGCTGLPQKVDLIDAWDFYVPVAIHYTNDTNITEDIGIPPDNLVRTDSSSFTNNIDPIIDSAVSLLQNMI